MRRHNNHLLPCSPALSRRRHNNHLITCSPALPKAPPQQFTARLSTVLLGRTSAREPREPTTDNESTPPSQPGTGDIVQPGAQAPRTDNRQPIDTAFFLSPVRATSYSSGASPENRQPTTNRHRLPSPVRATSYSSGCKPREPTTNRHRLPSPVRATSYSSGCKPREPTTNRHRLLPQPGTGDIVQLGAQAPRTDNQSRPPLPPARYGRHRRARGASTKTWAPTLLSACHSAPSSPSGQALQPGALRGTRNARTPRICSRSSRQSPTLPRLRHPLCLADRFVWPTGSSAASATPAALIHP